MNQGIILALLLTIGMISCKNSERKNDKLKIAEKYFEALDHSNSSEMKLVLDDSLLTVVPEYEYEIKYAREDYIGKWLKWDSVFNPTYKVLELKLENGNVKAKISKIDKRIHFFMEGPFITNEILSFENDKIIIVQTEYVNFDESTWEKNKNELLSWIKKNHPELNLNRYIYEQTKEGGKKLLKAIELYNNRE